MIIKYRMLSGITIQQFQNDIAGLIDGTITSVSGLSAGCDIANSSITGTYPAGKYSRVNGTTFTFSKVHSTDNTRTHFFRLTFSASALTNIALAQSYVSGTDTLVNSSSYAVTVTPNAYNTRNISTASGVTIVITDSCINFTSLYSGVSFGIHDLGENGITSTYTDSMKMTYVRLNDNSFSIPYTHNLIGRLSSYVTIAGVFQTVGSFSPSIVSNNTGTSTIIVESPVFITAATQAYAVFAVLGLQRIPTAALLTDSQYTANTIIRQTAFGYAIITE
jgi:hypothetical protein